METKLPFLTDAEFAELLRANFITVTDDLLDRLFDFYIPSNTEKDQTKWTSPACFLSPAFSTLRSMLWGQVYRLQRHMLTG